MGKHSRNRVIQVIQLLSLTVLVVLSGVMWTAAQGIKPHGATPVPRPADKGEKSGDKVEKVEKKDLVRIRKFVATGRQILEKTPEYRHSAARGVKPAGDWAQITLTYDTTPDWIDELVFQYYVMALKTEGGKKAYSFFKTTVKYIDIEKGRDHLSSVYLRPSTLKRYGSVVAAAVEISHEGHVIEEMTESEIPMPEKWWTKADVVENKDVTVRDGYLLDRSQTPFVFVNIDDYEASK